MGGFRHCEANEIKSFLDDFFKDEPGFVRSFCVGAYGVRGKVEFDTSDHMWAFLVSYKGKKIASSLAAMDRPVSDGDPALRLLWHNVDKYPDELVASRKGNHGKFLLFQALQQVYPDVDIAILDRAVDANREKSFLA